MGSNFHSTTTSFESRPIDKIAYKYTGQIFLVRQYLNQYDNIVKGYLFNDRISLFLCFKWYTYIYIFRSGGDFIFNYSSLTCPEFMRRFTLTIPFKVTKGLEVINLDILSCDTSNVGSASLLDNESENGKGLQPSSSSSSSSVPSSTNDSRYWDNGFCLVVCEILNPTTKTYQLNCVVEDTGK